MSKPRESETGPRRGTVCRGPRTPGPAAPALWTPPAYCWAYALCDSACIFESGLIHRPRAYIDRQGAYVLRTAEAESSTLTARVATTFRTCMSSVQPDVTARPRAGTYGCVRARQQLPCTRLARRVWPCASYTGRPQVEEAEAAELGDANDDVVSIVRRLGAARVARACARGHEHSTHEQRSDELCEALLHHSPRMAFSSTRSSTWHLALASELADAVRQPMQCSKMLIAALTCSEQGVRRLSAEY